MSLRPSVFDRPEVIVLIPLLILTVPSLVAGFVKYREQKKALERAAKPDRTSLKQRVDGQS